MRGKWALFALVIVASVATPREARADSCVDDAIGPLRTAAMDSADHAAGLTASKLYLEALNAKATANKKAPRLDCFDAMEADVPKLLALHCAKGSGRTEDETCVLLDKIQVDIDRLRAQKLVEEADKSANAEKAQALYDRAARAYLDTFRDHCEAPSFAKQPVHPSIQNCTEMAYNAARAFSASHQTHKTIAMHRMLIAFDERVKASSPLAVKSIYELGGAYQSVAMYEEAAEQFERYATLHPRSANADAALRDAVILRLGLSQDVQALKDATIYVKNYGITKRAETAAITLAIAWHHADREAWDKATTTLTTSMERLDRGPPDITARAHLLLARAHAKSGKPERAREEYAKVRGLWSDPAAAERAIRRGWPDEDEPRGDRRLAQTLNAVGEAMFAGAEEKRRAEVESLKLPVFTGPHERAAILEHVQTKVRPWFEKKRSAIERIEPEYVKILELRPVPPPLWVIAAGASVGQMWGDFTDEFRQVPIPEAWRKNNVLYHAYYDAIDQMSASIRASRAKPAMRKCVALSAKYQVSDARADGCARWLAMNYKAEYHLDDEIIPSFRATTGIRAAAPVNPLPEPWTPPDK